MLAIKKMRILFCLTMALSVQVMSEDKGKMLDAGIVVYQENEKGVESYQTRLIVTSDYLRSDDGKDKGDYTLIDRKKNIIYNVSHDEKTVLVIKGSKVTTTLADASTKPVEKKLDKSIDPKAPLIEGNKVTHLKATINGKICRQYLLVPKVMPDMVAALKSQRKILAGQHSRLLGKTPKDYRDPCFVVYNIIDHSHHLNHGLVVQEWNDKGKRKQLTHYEKKKKISANLFLLPKGYKHYQIGDLGRK